MTTAPTAVVASGHMIDTPDRPVPRFPPGQIPRVTAEIRRALAHWGAGPATTLVCGGARGPDLIAAEEALALGALVKVCLARPREAFVADSVTLPGTDWAARFDAVLERAEVEVLPDPVGDDVYVRANERIVEVARSLARGRPHAVVVWNGGGGDGPGGTSDFLDRLGYTAPDKRLVVIDPTPRAYEAKQTEPGPKKLLALDGGGIRGVLSLEILAAIESGLRRELGVSDLVLGDYFDYVGGTSTGAIIAAGLASGMNVDTLLGHYKSLGRKSFSRSLVPVRALYQAKPLLAELTRVFGAETTLGSPSLRALLLLVMHNTSTDSAWPLSNCTQAVYNRVERCLPDKNDRNLGLPLAELLRGSTAAPVYFPPQHLRIGNNEFIFQDGGITPFNNPALLLLLMATLPEYGLEWPVGEDRLLVVSVGTGAAPAAHEGLARRQVGYFFNAKNLTSVFMNGASVGQDVQCRSLGCCRYGEPIDREFGARLDVTGIAGSSLFTYLRYNADLSPKALEKRGITSRREQRRLRKLDKVRAMPRLREIGRSVGAAVDVSNHFRGFL